MSKLVLGVDIGITSVGWAITDEETGIIIDTGVRLFKEGDKTENTKRRTFRSGRRLKRRRAHRIEDFVDLACDEGLVTENYKLLSNPIACRVKGLTQPLSHEELFTALYHIVKKRGSSLEVVEENSKAEEDSQSTKLILNNNDKLIASGLFVCQIVNQRLNERGKYKGETNVFRTKHYVQEAKEILKHQQVSPQFKENVIKLINRRRHFSEGPGSAKSPSMYGRYILQPDGSIEVINLIEKMRGRCSVYPDQLRAPKFAPSAELFNLLNDFNNLKVLNEPLDIDTKKDLINTFIRKDKSLSVTITKLCKHLNVNTEDITGFRIDKQEKPIFTDFKGLKAFLKAISDDNVSFFLDNFTIIDEIMVTLTSTKVVEERIQQLKEIQVIIPCLSDFEIESIANIAGISQYHALSLKAIYELNNEMIATQDNQMQVLHRLKLADSDIHKYEGLKNIPYDRSAILSPIAKRAQQEAIKVINQVRMKHGELAKIFIELARDNNSDEEKTRIKKAQRNFEDVNKNLQTEFNVESLNPKIRLKLRLYKEQDGKCVYTGVALNPHNIVNDANAYDIDHIIPLSVSLDDSMANKVLVTVDANRSKGNLTPIQAFRLGRFNGWSEAEFRSYVSHLSAYKYGANKKKLGYLLDEREITSYTNMKDFIARNLVDTRYASRVVLNTLQDYFKANAINTRVIPINGQITSMLRSKIGIKKSRDESYFHHAIDAATLTIMSQQSHFNTIFENVQIDNKSVNIDTDGIPVFEDKDFLTETFMRKLVPLKELAEGHEFKEGVPFRFVESNIKVSHKVDKKPNRAVSDQTIYSTRQTESGEKVVKKYKDIYDPKFLDVAKDILANEARNKYLMAIHDPKTFEKIENIVNNYYAEFKTLKENPLAVFKEQHGCVRKYAKHGNGAQVHTLKYLEDTLNSHIDITPNYESNNNPKKKKRVVLLQIKPYRTDFYVNEKGQYKFLTIRRKDVKYFANSNLYCINEDFYTAEKHRKGIDATYQFLFSMHRDELLYIERVIKNSDKSTYISKDIWKFTATNNDTTNIIEVKPVHYYDKGRNLITISKNILRLNKMHSDTLGKIYESKNNDLKLAFTIDKL